VGTHITGFFRRMSKRGGGLVDDNGADSVTLPLTAAWSVGTRVVGPPEKRKLGLPQRLRRWAWKP